MELEADKKTEFAAAWLRLPNDPFKAAQTVFGASDVGNCLRAAAEWTHDEFVTATQQQLLKKHGARFFLPTKEEYAMTVYHMAQDCRVAEDKIKALRLYGEVMGFIEKPGVTINNAPVINRVMVVKDHGTENEWEQRAMAQQKKLTTDAAATEQRH